MNEASSEERLEEIADSEVVEESTSQEQSEKGFLDYVPETAKNISRDTTLAVVQNPAYLDNFLDKTFTSIRSVNIAYRKSTVTGYPITELSKLTNVLSCRFAKEIEGTSKYDFESSNQSGHFPGHRDVVYSNRNDATNILRRFQYRACRAFYKMMSERFRHLIYSKDITTAKDSSYYSSQIVVMPRDIGAKVIVSKQNFIEIKKICEKLVKGINDVKLFDMLSAYSSNNTAINLALQCALAEKIYGNNHEIIKVFVISKDGDTSPLNICNIESELAEQSFDYFVFNNYISILFRPIVVGYSVDNVTNVNSMINTVKQVSSLKKYLAMQEILLLRCIPLCKD